MSILSIARTATVAGVLIAPGLAAAETLTVDEFRRELVGLPLCGTPMIGPLAGKSLCTVHLPDGTAILAGSGLLVRGVWDIEDGHVCRRNAHDPPERRRCVDYDRTDAGHYRNTDGVEFCIGPCPPAATAAIAAPTPTAAAAAAPPPVPAPAVTIPAAAAPPDAAPQAEPTGAIREPQKP
jgi:hypothetical protein